QWFVAVEKLAKMSAAAVRAGDTKIHPEAQEARFFEWVDNMHDWTISRQLWWGHRIPIWYGPEDADGNRDIICLGPDETAPEGYEQDPDVLDTWFSSALWPFSTLGWPEKTPDLEKFYPTNVLVTGYDIIFFWVARMMMFGTFASTETPELLAPGTTVAHRFHSVISTCTVWSAMSTGARCRSLWATALTRWIGFVTMVRMLCALPWRAALTPALTCRWAATLRHRHVTLPPSYSTPPSSR